MRAARGLLGLRGRFAAALVLMAVVTLAIAAVAVLSPLQRSLQDSEVSTLADTAKAAHDSFVDLDPSDLHPGSRSLSLLTRRLARNTGALVAVIDRAGRILSRTDDVDPGQAYSDGARAISTLDLQRGFGTEGDERVARVALPVRVGRHEYAVVLRKSLVGVSGAVSVVRRAFIVAALASLVAALVLGMLLATRLVRRLRALRTTAMRVAELGPTVELQADHTHDEVGDLTRSFATMQEHLRAQEEARRTFVASASHELRTPLQSLLFMLDLLHEDLGQEAPDMHRAREDARRARAQAQRLTGLSTELLDLSRLDAGVALRSELVELVGLCRSVLAEFEARSAEAEIRIELATGPAVWVVADPGAVAQIMRVLVDNALRFSPPSTRIEVAPTTGAVAVTDEGPGVPDQERETVFERFRRGQESGGGAGFGLGLAIGRELARRMGGDLRLDGEGPGARFVLTLIPAPAGVVGDHDTYEASER